MIQMYPDHKLIPEAKQRLLQVQEVLAEREFRIGSFYYLRESYPAAIARLKSLTDTYPLYSGADEALYLLGQAYEGQMEVIRAGRFNEVQKANMLRDLTARAAAAYAKIRTRYPAMDRFEDAKERLEALKQAVPEPTAEMIAQNKAEEASRGKVGIMRKFRKNFSSRPDVIRAARVGEPIMQEPEATTAQNVVKTITESASVGTQKATIETVKGAPGENAPPPRSDDGAPKEAPAAVNDATPEASATSSQSDKPVDKKSESTSKKKKKKGLGKLNPF
jgi:outer membrane protein assembly factor BamD